jgi:hypothetical protein
MHKQGLERDELKPDRLPPRHCEPRLAGEAIHQQTPRLLVDCFVTALLAMMKWMIPLQFIML